MSDIEFLEQIVPGHLPLGGGEFVNTFGCKSYGLTRIPANWRPAGLAVSIEACREYRTSGSVGVQRFFSEQWNNIARWLDRTGSHGPLLIRSSGTNETVQDRGRYLSVPVELPSDESLAAAACQIFQHFVSLNHDSEMALLIQPNKRARLKGHASNFRRVSKTRNQWQAEIETSNLGDRTITAGYTLRYNSQRHAPANDAVCLPSVKNSDGLGELLKQVGAWLNAHVDDVVSIEWLDDGNAFWVVQCDDETDPLGAVDPAELTFVVDRSPRVIVNELPSFKRHVVGQETPVRKLKVLEDFNTPSYQASHNIFHSTAAGIEPLLRTENSRTSLANRIDEFGPKGVVIRTEVTAPDAGTLPNLPRTDTVVGAQAVEWLYAQFRQLHPGNYRNEDIHFLLHRFIPACASAWSYHEPSQRIVRIDGIWGLPDGLQFYPHDSYEFDLVEQKIIRTYARYKPYVLWPNITGKWEALPVRAKKARAQALTGADIKWIANYTSEISAKIGGPAQVMWFLNFDETSDYERPLPWFRETKPIRPAVLEAAPEARTFRIRTLADLQKAREDNSRIRRLLLEPEVSLIRENINRESSFIDEVIRLCKDRQYSVVFSGSVLSHAFYQLAAAGIAVYSSTDSGRKRTINKHEFGKLVRDLIPSNIAKRGEAVRYGIVDAQFKRSLLLGKLIEEISELSQAGEATRIEELADVYEVLRGIVQDIGVSWDELVRTADVKAEKRGGFSKGVVLLETSLSEAEEIDDLQGTPSLSSVPLIQEPTAAAVKASLSIRVSDEALSIPISTLLSGKSVVHALGGPHAGDRVRVVLCGDRLEVTLQKGTADTKEQDCD